MVNFSEKMVRTVSLIVFFALLFVGWKNSWLYILEILPIMIYFSTKGVVMFEDKLWWGTRIFWALLFSLCLFLFLYKQMPEINLTDRNLIITRAVIALCMGSWFGDFFAKYIYIRLRFCINRIGASSFRGEYKILSVRDYAQKYVKSPFKKMKISFYYVTLEVKGKEITFLTSHEIFEEIKNQKIINITIKKGLLSYYYGVGYETRESL